MAGNATQLKQRLAAIDLELSNLVYLIAPALPDAQGGGGLQFVAYRKSLYEEREMLLKAISIADGPWELETRMP
ncbi:MAG TPA: hypothetical protein VGP68_14530 [Gemmataceae bacterium]|jgi:hypothetical protein|nr:hypothetical protein [Gemmataceae bacterium]